MTPQQFIETSDCSRQDCHRRHPREESHEGQKEQSRNCEFRTVTGLSPAARPTD